MRELTSQIDHHQNANFQDLGTNMTRPGTEIDIKRVSNKYHAFNYNQSVIAKADYFIVGQDTKDFPEEMISPGKQVSNLHSQKEYLSQMVHEVIKNKKEHNLQFADQNGQIQPDCQSIFNSRLQVIQQDSNKQEFEDIKPEQEKYLNEYLSEMKFKKDQSFNQKKFSQNDDSSLYPLREADCKQFISKKAYILNRDTQIKLKKQQSNNNQGSRNDQFQSITTQATKDPNTANFNYDSIEQMGDRPLDTFIHENQIYPYYYLPSFPKKERNQQVSRFEFNLVKGNQYLCNEEYQKALKFFTDGFSFHPNSQAYKFNIAVVHFMLKQYDKALLIYRSLFSELPNNACVFMNLLLTHLLLGQHTEIMKFKDKNGMSRPRALMNQMEMNINKIIVYSTSALQKLSKQMLVTQSNVQKKQETQQIESYWAQERNKQQQHSSKVIQVKEPQYQNCYFKIRPKTQQRNRTKLHQTQSISLQRQASLSKTLKTQKKIQQISLIEQDKLKFQEQRQRFNEILEQKRQVLKEKDVIYGNIETTIIKEGIGSDRRASADQRSSKLYFTITPIKRSSSLDHAFQQLSDAFKSYTTGIRDPIEDKYKELMEDLKAFKHKINIDQFVQHEFDSKKDKRLEDLEKRDRPWSRKKRSSRDQNSMMGSTQMQRARSFIKSAFGRGKSKKETYRIVENIQGLIEEHVRITNEEGKTYQQKKDEEETRQALKGLKIKNRAAVELMTDELEMDSQEIRDLDKSFIERLENLQDINQLSEDQKIMQALRLTKEDLEKRKDLQNDKFLSVLSPDGTTQEDREAFDKDTDEFLSYLYNNYMIKSAIVAGTEVYDLFNDSLEIDLIRKYLDKLTLTITQRFGAFQDQKSIEEKEELVWESPLIHKREKKVQLQNTMIKKGQDMNQDKSNEGNLAYLFVQKLKTMGLISKIVKENMSRIKVKKQIGSSVENTNSDLSIHVVRYIEKHLQRKTLLQPVDIQVLDNFLCELKFFSIFEKDIRMKIYKLCSLHKFYKLNQVIDNNILTTEYMYVILAGQVSILKNDFQLGIKQPLLTLKAGECFGDLSIQSNKVSDYDLSNKNMIFAQNDTECHLLRFERKLFIESLFREMKDNLYNKIMMLKNTEFFEDLSPYALVILASNIQVREYQLGDVIIRQGQIPHECCIILEGECKAAYEKEIKKSTQVSRFAKKCLQTNLPKPMHHSTLSYAHLAQLGINDNQKEESEKKQRDRSMKQKYIMKLVQENPHKHSFQNEVLNQDQNQKTIDYRHHIVFNKLKPGNCLGFRSLLDKQIIRRHIIDEQESYSEQLGITLDNIQYQMQKKSQSPTLKQPASESQSPKKSSSQEGAKSKISKKLMNKFKAQVQQLTNSDQDNSIEGNYLGQINQTQQLPMVNGIISESGDSNRNEDEEHQVRQLMILKSRLYDALIDDLMKAQVSIVADTAVVKVMVLKREDKNFLNETLKSIIDRKLLEKRFRDYDRPLDNMQEILKIVDKEQEWKSYKEKLETDMLREVAMTKKINKLLD